MSLTFQVRFWEIQFKKGRRRPYGVRWITAGREHSEWFANKAQASSRRSELMTAARAGEAFDIETGLPESELRKRNSLSLLEFAQSHVDLKWPDAAAKTRASIVDALATAVAAFVDEAPGRPGPEDLRRVLVAHLLPVSTRDRTLKPTDEQVVAWLRKHSRPLHDMAETSAARSLLDAAAVRMDGKASAASVYRRKRAVMFNMAGYAVERGLLPDNPFVRVKRKAPKLDGEVDPGVVASPAQVRELLNAVTYIGRRNQDRGAHLFAFFATCYYAAARPSEGLALKESDCVLPQSGWGELALGESRPAAGKRWTDTGEVHDRRGLKHRAAHERRFVPIPPALVAILREHIDRYGVVDDGRLFRSPSGSMVGAGTYSRVWDAARSFALPPGLASSPLAGRPYDLRHAAVSLWLNGGVPATEVAARAGHSVDVLLRVYAKCVYGQRDAVNRQIDGLYGDDVE